MGILKFEKTWTDGKGIMLSKLNQTEKGEYWISHLYVES